MNTFDLVLHVDAADNSLALALHNYMNYAAALAEEPFKAVLVANSAAVRLLKAENKALENAVAQAVSHGLDLRVCRNALNDNGIRPEELFPQCVVVPAGLVEVVRLQNEGFAYVKP